MRTLEIVKLCFFDSFVTEMQLLSPPQQYD